MIANLTNTQTPFRLFLKTSQRITTPISPSSEPCNLVLNISENDIQISTDPDNLLEKNATGLFVGPPDSPADILDWIDALDAAL